MAAAADRVDISSVFYVVDVTDPQKYLSGSIIPQDFQLDANGLRDATKLLRDVLADSVTLDTFEDPVLGCSGHTRELSSLHTMGPAQTQTFCHIGTAWAQPLSTTPAQCERVPKCPFSRDPLRIVVRHCVLSALLNNPWLGVRDGLTGEPVVTPMIVLTTEKVQNPASFGPRQVEFVRMPCPELLIVDRRTWETRRNEVIAKVRPTVTLDDVRQSATNLRGEWLTPARERTARIADEGLVIAITDHLLREFLQERRKLEDKLGLLSRERQVDTLEESERLAKLGYLKQAKVMLERILANPGITREPNARFHAFFLLATILYEQGNFNEANRFYVEAITTAMIAYNLHQRLNLDFLTCQLRMADAMRAAKETEKALVTYRQVPEQDPAFQALVRGQPINQVLPAEPDLNQAQTMYIYLTCIENEAYCLKELIRQGKHEAFPLITERFKELKKELIELVNKFLGWAKANCDRIGEENPQFVAAQLILAHAFMMLAKTHHLNKDPSNSFNFAMQAMHCILKIPTNLLPENLSLLQFLDKVAAQLGIATNELVNLEGAEKKIYQTIMEFLRENRDRFVVQRTPDADQSAFADLSDVILKEAKEAVNVLIFYLSTHPRTRSLLLAVGNLYFALNDFENARRYLEPLAQASDDNRSKLAYTATQVRNLMLRANRDNVSADIEKLEVFLANFVKALFSKTKLEAKEPPEIAKIVELLEYAARNSAPFRTLLVAVNRVIAQYRQERESRRQASRASQEQKGGPEAPPVPARGAAAAAAAFRDDRFVRAHESVVSPRQPTRHGFFDTRPPANRDAAALSADERAASDFFRLLTRPPRGSF